MRGTYKFIRVTRVIRVISVIRVIRVTRGIRWYPCTHPSASAVGTLDTICEKQQDRYMQIHASESCSLGPAA